MIKEMKKYHQCEECKLLYKDKKWAERCERWCTENKSCNLEITKHALKGGKNNETKFRKS